MKQCILLLLMLSTGLTALSQFSGGRHILYQATNDTYYIITSSGQIWYGSPETEFTYAGASVGANVGQCLIIEDTLYCARIDDIKIYSLDPVQLLSSHETPATEWMIGLAWDGDQTLYCHDQEAIYSMDMDSFEMSTVNTDLSNWSEVKEMVYHPYMDKLVIIDDQSDSEIITYDVASDTYEVVLELEDLDMTHIDLGCNDHFLLTGGGNGTGIAYAVPYDFSHAGDTVTFTGFQPRDAFYEPLSAEAYFLMDDSLHVLENACLPTGLDALESEVRPQIWYDGMLNIRDSDKFFSEGIRLRLFDLSGRAVHELDIPDLSSELRIPLDINAPGLYMVQCVGRNGKRQLVETLYFE